MLRLKRYTKKIYELYTDLSGDFKEEDSNVLVKTVRSKYALLCQTVLFFNQSIEDMTLEEWCDRVPVSYILKIDFFVSLLEESARWIISAIELGEGHEPHALQRKILEDIQEFQILALNELPEDKDILTAEFGKCCDYLHSTIPNNLRKRKGLIRFVRCYLIAKQITNLSHNLSNCDRLEYLKRLTSY